MFSLADAARISEALDSIARIETKLIGVSSQINVIGGKMTTLEENLSALSTAVTGIEEDVSRVLAALADENLSPEAQAAVDALKTRMDNLNASMDTAVPPAPPEPTP